METGAAINWKLFPYVLRTLYGNIRTVMLDGEWRTVTQEYGSKHEMRVTAALIPNGNRIFVAQRPPWKRFGLMWEFPGGKVEPGEGLEESLIREIREELCLEIRVRAFFRTISYSEGDFSLDLHAFWCTILRGHLCLREHVAYRWAYVSELKGFHLTEADRRLLPHLERLPRFPQYSAPSSS